MVGAQNPFEDHLVLNNRKHVQHISYVRWNIVKAFERLTTLWCLSVCSSWVLFLGWLSDGHGLETSGCHMSDVWSSTATVCQRTECPSQMRLQPQLVTIIEQWCRDLFAKFGQKASAGSEIED